MKIIIIGGVAAGASAAAKLSRELKGEKEIVIFEKSSKISFSNCGLPYGISGVSKIEDLAPQDFKSMESMGVQVNVLSEATKIDEANKTVTVKDLKTGKSKSHKYDKLIVTTGARVADFKIKGMDKEEKAFGIRTFDDMNVIINNLKGASKALVVGGGFIGVEMAEALSTRGINVHLVEPRAKLAGFDYDFSSFLEEKLRMNNITLHLGKKISEIDSKNKKFIVEPFAGGEKQEFGYDIIIKTGITPNTEIFKGTSVVVDEKGLVETNKYMQTKNKDIYAAGDIVYTPHVIGKYKMHLPFARQAKAAGRVIAEHIAGVKTNGQYKATGAAGFKVFGEEFALVGFTENQTKKFDIPHNIVMASVASNASYVPTGKLTMKMVFNSKTEKLIGLQAYGKFATKAVDAFATALTAGMTLNDLAELDLVYQPHLSTTINPLNTIADVALNERRYGFTSECPIHITREEPHIDNFIIDTRDAKQHAEKGHLEGAVNIPTKDLSIETVGLPLNKSVVVHCNTGFGASFAARKLRELGYTNVRNVFGGNNLYQLMIKK